MTGDHTPLAVAARHGCADVVRWLVDDADADATMYVGGYVCVCLSVGVGVGVGMSMCVYGCVGDVWQFFACVYMYICSILVHEHWLVKVYRHLQSLAELFR